MNTMEADAMNDAMNFYVPPQNRGQIVEVAYAHDGDGHVYRRVIDQSLPSGDRERITYYQARMLLDDDGDYWNRAPSNQRWREIEESEVPEELG